MNSVDGEPKTLLDTTADYLTSTIFGSVDDSDDVDVEDDDDDDDDDVEEEEEEDDEKKMKRSKTGQLKMVHE